MKRYVLCGAFALGVSACATPEVVQVTQVGDEALACEQLEAGIVEAQRFERDAREERGVTGTNVAAAILFVPGLVGTYVNTDEAIDAARDRQERLTDLHLKKGCAVG